MVDICFSLFQLGDSEKRSGSRSGRYGVRLSLSRGGDTDTNVLTPADDDVTPRLLFLHHGCQRDLDYELVNISRVIIKKLSKLKIDSVYKELMSKLEKMNKPYELSKISPTPPE